MPKSPTAYYCPQDLDEALSLLTQPDTVPLAGGTKLLTGDVETAVIDLQALGLNWVEWSDQLVRIGSAIKLTDLVEALAEIVSEQTSGPAAMLQKAIRQAGPNTYRNAATIGGCIASRLPDSELLAALLVLEVELTLFTPEQVTISLVDYLSEAERPSGLITEIYIPWSEGIWASERVARTPADYPIVSVTLWQPIDQSLRLAGTGMAARPSRLTNAETILAAGLTDETISQTVAAAEAACNHPGDFRGDAEYRAEMTAVLTKRVCKAAAAKQ